MLERIILLGANGQLGMQLQECVPKAVSLFAFTSAELDICKTDQLQKTCLELAQIGRAHV